jgi:4'-phosphopantetheinyl transferase
MKEILLLEQSQLSPPPLENNSIHIWTSLYTSIPTGAALSEEEKLQSLEYIPKEREKFINRRSFLRHLISGYLDKQPEEILLAKTEAGKLFLPEDATLQFSTTDSIDTLAAAFGKKTSLGIDIEKVRDLPEMETILSSCFSPCEQAYIKKEDSLKRFWQLWNRKEACLKAMGTGIDRELQKCDCLGTEDITTWTFLKPQGVWIQSIELASSCTLAIAYIEEKKYH